MKLSKKARAAAKVEPAQTRLVQELKHTSPLVGCRIDPTGRFVFASAQDSTIQRWELATGKKTVLAGHKSWVRGLAFHPTEKLLVSADYAGRVLVWPTDRESPQPMRAIEAHHGWVRAVAVSPDGRYFATCGNDHLVKLWSAANGKSIRALAGHDSHVYNVAFHRDGKHLVSADLKGVIKQWDFDRGAHVRDLDAHALHKYDPSFRADIGGIRGMAFNSDGTLLACTGITEVTNAFAGVGKPLTVLFDWQTGKQKQLLVPKEHFQGTGWGVAFLREGFIAGVGGGNGGALWFWRPEQPQAFFTLKLPNNARDLSLHPDGERFAIAFFDGAVRVYSMMPKAVATG
jgi:WD40 repeat protein